VSASERTEVDMKGTTPSSTCFSFAPFLKLIKFKFPWPKCSGTQKITGAFIVYVIAFSFVYMATEPNRCFVCQTKEGDVL